MELENPNLLIALAFMICSAGALVWVGAKRSVPYAAQGKTERMSSHDAMRFPITGSCVLGGLYLLIKFIPKEILIALLSIYLTLISIGTLSAFVRPYVGANVMIGSIVCAIGGAFFFSKHWILNNVLAYSICVVGIEAMQLKTYYASAILLIGLFFYDIFWVFGTDVMVTVATNIEGPIKLLFPQDIFGDHQKKSLLGLGDIVIPGFFISQMLRFSLVMYVRHRQGAKKGKKGSEKKKQSSEAAVATTEEADKPTNSLAPVADSFNISSWDQCCYFHVAFVAYILSLLNTMGVMVFFNAAQPALLYIVPWLLIATLLFAIIRGDFKALISFEEEEHPPTEETEEEKKKREEEENMSFFPSLLLILKSTVLFVFGMDDETLKEKAKAKEKKQA